MAQKDLESIEHQRDALVALKATAGVAVMALMKIQDHRKSTQEDAQLELKKLDQAFHSETGDLNGLDAAKFPELKEIIQDAKLMQSEMQTLLMQAQQNMNTTRNGKRIKRNRLVDRTLLVSAILNSQSIAKRIVASEASFKISDVERVNTIQKNLNLAIFAVLGINALITVIFVSLFTRDVAGRLKLVADNTHKLAQPGKALVPCPGTDEIAAIDAELREVAAKLEDFRRQQLSILDNAVDVVFTIDDKLKLQALNNASREKWGVAPDELLGRNFLSLLAKESRKSVGEEINKFLAERSRQAQRSQMELRLEAVVLLPTSESRTFEITFSKLPDASGLTGVARDVTQEKAVAALKERLLAIVSHDLRTPLASLSITLSVQVEGKRIADKDLNSQLAAIDKDVQKVMDLTHQLLKMEKQETELADISFDRVKAYNVWLTVKSEILPLCKERSIALTGPDCDAEIWGNEVKLVESVTLAAKTILSFCADKSNLRFEIQTADSGTTVICLSVDKLAQDQGSPASVVERLRSLDDENIFDSDNLSLSIARAIVKRHGGEMRFATRDAGGLEITIALPIVAGVC
ncbi:MAG: HAMP domain-containing histidine kinase [Candidatus Melainabacteria bacterium]|nr:HAMP domain-containing histidine kinase [Candidatus Melainabacteria bacterium]